LRYDSTVRQPATVFDEIKPVKLDKEMIELAQHIIDKKAATFDPSEFDDKYEEALIELIRAKKAGRKAPRAKAAARPSNVVNLFDALKKSLAADNDEGATTTKASKKSPEAKKAAARKKSA
jgi:DNA end-binding protein Ku